MVIAWHRGSHPHLARHPHLAPSITTPIFQLVWIVLGRADIPVRQVTIPHHQEPPLRQPAFCRHPRYHSLSELQQMICLRLPRRLSLSIFSQTGILRNVIHRWVTVPFHLQQCWREWMSPRVGPSDLLHTRDRYGISIRA
jgi:hypothetical protein